jgi:hypothetical protein
MKAHGLLPDTSNTSPPAMTSRALRLAPLDEHAMAVELSNRARPAEADRATSRASFSIGGRIAVRQP